MANDDTRTAELPDGRTLAWAEAGDREGVPVVVFTTSLGSRLLPPIQHRQLAAAGARGIAIDRPGIGLSTFQPNRRVTDCAADAAAVADACGLDRFAVWGCHHAAKYALACAHQLPERVVAVGCVDGVGPLSDPRFMDGLSEEMRAAFDGIKSAGPHGSFPERVTVVDLALEDPAALDAALFQFPGELPVDGYDKQEMLEWLRAMVPDACQQGDIGHAYDNWLILQPWGFDLPVIRAPVRLWAGDTGVFPYARHAGLLREQLPSARTTIWEGETGWHSWLSHGQLVLDDLVAAAS